MQLNDFSTDMYTYLLILKIWMANTNEPTIVSAWYPVVYEHPKAILKSINPMVPQWLSKYNEISKEQQQESTSQRWELYVKFCIFATKRTVRIWETTVYLYFRKMSGHINLR